MVTNDRCLVFLPDVPDAPGAPDIVDWDKHRADLKWKAPKRDGGAPITGYVIEKKDQYRCALRALLHLI